MEAVKATASPTLTKGDKKKMKRERRVRYLKDNSPYLLMILPAVLVTLKIRVAEPFSFVMPLAGVEVLERPWVFILAILIGILFTIPRLPSSRFYAKLTS